MNQLYTFSSEQFTSCLKPAIAKRVLPFEDALQKRRQQHEKGGVQSKKKMKRYQQIMQIASRQFGKEEAQQKCQLKSYAGGHFSNIKLNLQPMTMKLRQKKEENMFKSKSKRCNSQMNVNHHDDTLLFTFYPNQPSKEHQQTGHPVANADNEFTHLEKRSFSMKNAPFVNYPNCNKLLPKVFRSKTGADDGLPHLKRVKNMSDLSIGERDKKAIQRQFRMDELRNQSKAQESTNVLKLNLQKIKIPLKRVVQFKKAATLSKIDSQNS